MCGGRVGSGKAAVNQRPESMANQGSCKCFDMDNTDFQGAHGDIKKKG